jgi:tetratricopeptide (TPR) repeat protein
MNTDDLSRTAKEAVYLWAQCRYADAEPLFRRVLPHLDRSHYRASDFLSYFGFTLERLGKLEEAKSILQESLRSALLSDQPDSVTVSMARFALGEFLFRRHRYDESLDAIEPSLTENSDGRWLTLYLSARIYYREKRATKFRAAAESVYLAAPKGKFRSVRDVMARVAADDSHDC